MSMFVYVVLRAHLVVRFRGRYYRFYNKHDSYPGRLGAEIVGGIPVDPEGYQQWLAERRGQALEWHVALQRLLCRKRADDEDNVYADEDTNALDDGQGLVEKPADVSFSFRGTGTNKDPWGVVTKTLPDFTPPFNGSYTDEVYIIDLDNEVFTIDNGVHFHLNRIPRFDCLNAALDFGCHGERVLLPDIVPDEAIADLVVRPPSSIAKMHINMLDNLDISFVKAKGLDAFPPMQRHGPLLQAKIFKILQSNYKQVLSATLLSWRPDDFLFRETAYAIFCLASASLNLSFVPLKQVSQKGRMGFADFENTNGESEKAEFLAHLGVGCHLEGLPPGSSPESGMYWFEGALVCLVVQLHDCPEAVSQAVTRTVEYCRSQRPDQCVNAILMSIEHIVLMSIYPGGRVERTELLTLFDIPIHTSKKASARCHAECLEEPQICDSKRYDARRKEKARKWKAAEEYRWLWKLDIESDEHVDEELRDSMDEQTSHHAAGLITQGIEDTETTFMALTNFLEVSSRRQMSPSRPNEGIFPTEIYQTILLHLEDLQTHHACMRVSRNFRDLCQRNNMVMDGVVLQAIDTSRTYNPTSASFLTLRMKTLSMGLSEDVTLTPTLVGERDPNHTDRDWGIVVGSGRNRRSILPKLVVCLGPTNSCDPGGR